MGKSFVFIFSMLSVSLWADTIEELRSLKLKMLPPPRAYQRIVDGYGWSIMHNPSPELMEKFLQPMENISKAMTGTQETQEAFVKNNGITNFRKLLRENLSSNDSGREALSALFLASMADKESIPQIARLLDIDRSNEKGELKNLVNIHRATAAVSLAQLNAAGPYEAKIAAMLDSPAAHDVLGATQAIQIMNWSQYLPKFGAMLKLSKKSKEDAKVRADMAIVVLGAMQAKKYAPKIVPFLKAKSSAINKEHVVIALAQMDAVGAADALALYYRDPKSDLLARRNIPLVLALFQSQTHKDIVDECLKDNSNKDSAMTTLALFGDEKDIPLLVEGLEKPEMVTGAAVGLMYMERKEYYDKIYEKLMPKLPKMKSAEVNQDDFTDFFRHRFGLTNADITKLDNAAAKVNRVWREIVASRKK